MESSHGLESIKLLSRVKGILTCSLILASPKFTKTFKLAVDTNDIGAGAVLLQENNKGCYNYYPSNLQTPKEVLQHRKEVVSTNLEAFT